MANSVTARIGIDDKDFNSGLARVRGEVEKLKNSSSSVGGLFGSIGKFFAAGAVIAGLYKAVGFATNLYNEIAKIKDLSETFDVSTGFFQAVDNVAKDAGGSTEALASFLTIMRKSRGEAMNGNEKVIKSFEALGITLKDLQTLNSEDLFNRIADGTMNAANANEAFYNATVIGGRGAAQMYNTLRMGSEEIRKLGIEIGVFSDKTVSLVDQAGKNFERLIKSIKISAAESFGWILAPVEALFDGTTYCIGQTLRTAKWFLEIFYRLGKGAAVSIYETFAAPVKSIIHLFKGEFKDALRSLNPSKAIKDAWKEAARDIKRDTKEIADSGTAAWEAYDRRATRRWKKPKKSNRMPDIDPETAMENVKAAEDLAKLKEKLNEESRKAAFEALDTLDKIKSLEAQIAEEKKKANNNTQEGINAQLKILELNKSLAREKKSFDEEEKRRREKDEADAKKILDMRKKVEETAFEYQFEKMSEAEKISVLQAKNADLLKKVSGDTPEGLQAQVDLISNQKRIDALTGKEKKEASIPSAILSSMAEIGGGGRVYKFGSAPEKQLAEAQKQTNILREIARNTERDDAKIIDSDFAMM